MMECNGCILLCNISLRKFQLEIIASFYLPQYQYTQFMEASFKITDGANFVKKTAVLAWGLKEFDIIREKDGVTVSKIFCKICK